MHTSRPSSNATPGPCVCARLRRASRALTRSYDKALEPHGLTVTQFSLLRNAERLDGPSVTRLAEATGHDRSGLWRSLQPLAREGLVVLSPGKDQRTRRVEITPAGRAATEAALPAWEGIQADVARGLGEDRRARLLALLEEIEALAD
jgi:DNA-binding MarR family transcriptional regulator